MHRSRFTARTQSPAFGAPADSLVPALILPPQTSNESWTATGGGDWSTGANWSTGAAPTASTAATIAAAGTYTVNITTQDAAASLVITDKGATIDDTGTLSIGTTMKISAGSFVLDSGGSLVGGTVSLAGSGGFTVQGGTLSGVTYDGVLNTNSSNLYVTGADSFAGSGGSGSGTIDLFGASLVAEDKTTLSGAVLDIGGSTTIYVAASDARAPATLTLGSTTSLVTAAGGLYEIDLYDDATSYGGTLINQGTITCTNSEGNSLTIYGQAGDVFLNEGKVSAGGGGTLVLQTNITGAGGSFAVAAGGTLMLLGGDTLNDAGGTLNIAAGGAFDLGGTVSGGTIIDGAGGLAPSSGTLSGVAYDGTLSVNTGNQEVYLTGADNFAGSGGTGLGVIDVDGGDYLFAVGKTTLNGATLNFGNASAADELYVDGRDSGSNATLTLGSALNLAEQAASSVGTIDLSSYGAPSHTGTLVNQGTITASASDGSLVITGLSGDVFTNTGRIAVSNGDTLVLDADVTGLGSFTTASGGELLVKGTISNTGSTIALGSSAQLTLDGTIAGGTINDSSGGNLLGAGGLLSGVAYQGTLSLIGTSSYLYLLGTENFASSGGTGTGVIDLTGAGASLFAEGSTTLNGATLNFGNTGGAAYIYGDGAVTGTNSTLTLGSTLDLVQSAAGSRVDIDLTDSNGSSHTGTLVNQGTITASASDGNFLVYAPGDGVFTNTGVIAVSNHDMVELDTDVSGLGHFTTTGGGVLQLDGGNTISNTGGTLSLGAGNQLTLAGTVSGGTIGDSGSGLIADGGTLSVVTYAGTLNLTGSDQIHATGGLDVVAGSQPAVFDITGSNAFLAFDDTQTFDNSTVNIGNDAGGNNLLFDSGAAQTLTLGSRLVISQNSQTGTYATILYDQKGVGNVLINQGSITAGDPGGTLSIIGTYAADKFTNLGTLAAANGGLLDISAANSLTNVNGGTLTAGVYEASANSTLQFLDNTFVTTDAAVIILSGAGSIFESEQTSTGKQVGLAQNLVTIASTGALELLGGQSFAAATAFTDAGLLQLGGGTFTAGAGLTLAGTGTLAGFGTATAGIADRGSIIATGGTLVLAGSVTGTGALQAAASATIDLTAGGTLTEKMAGAGTLKLDGATAYTLSAGSTQTVAAIGIDAGATLAGNATLTGAVQNAGTLAASGGTLALDGAIIGAGAETIAGGAVLDVDDGGTLTGAISGAGTLKLDGAAPLVLQTGAAITPAAVLVDAGATIDLTQGGSLGATLSGAGTLQLDGGTPYTLAGGTLAIGALHLDSGATLSATGTITGALSDNGTLSIPAGTLVVDGLLSGSGAITLAAGAVLNLHGGSTLTRTISGAGTLQLDAATYTLAGGTIAAAGTLIDAGAILSGTGSLTGSVADSGTVTATGGTLTLGGVATGTGALVAATGAVLDLGGGGALTEKLSGAGTLKLDGAAYTVADNAIAGSALAIGSGATLTAQNASISGAVSNAGSLAVAGASLNVHGAYSGAGRISAVAGGTLDFLGGGTFAGAASGAGTLKLDSTAYTLAASLAIATIAIDSGATLDGSGAITGKTVDSGMVNATGGTLSLAALSGAGTLSAAAGAVLHLQGGGALAESVLGAGELLLDGTYDFAGNTPFTIAKLVIDYGASLSATGTIASTVNAAGTLTAAAGTLALTGAVGGNGTLQAASGAVLDLKASTTLARTLAGAGTLELDGASYTYGTATSSTVATLAVDSGARLSGAGTIASTLIDAGSITATSGTLSFLGAVTNNGIADAASGLMSFMNALSGTGTLDIGSAGALALQAGASAGQTVDFLGSGGVLELSQPPAFLGGIAGFSGADTIDLINTASNGFTYSAGTNGGILSVTEGSLTVATLNFAGNYTSSSFSLASDGHGGTFVTFA